METTLAVWGNSLGVRIPKELLKKGDYKKGDKIEVELSGADIVLRKKVEEVPFSQIIAACSEPYDAEWVDWGKPEGNEIW
jgi:antitoxin MazE